jgi:hypothetical protein
MHVRPGPGPRSFVELSRELPTLVLMIGGSLLLGGFTYLPSQDLPNHVAITDLVLRLLRGAPNVEQYFGLRLFDFTYRLLFLLTVPLAALMGALAATRLVLVAMWIAYVLAGRAFTHALGLPAWGLVLLAPWFFGLQLFAGFLSSLLAVVLLLWSVWALMRAAQLQSRRYLAVAAVLGCLVGTAHVVLSILWAASVVAYAWPERRARWREAVVVGVAGLLPAILWIGMRLVAPGDRESNVLVPEYKHPFKFAAKAFIANVDAPWGDLTRDLLLALMVGLVGLLFWRRRRAPVVEVLTSKATQFLATTLVAWSLCFIVIPARTRGTWGLNLRCVEPILFVAAALAVTTAVALPKHWRRAVTVAVLVLVGASGVTLLSGFGRADSFMSQIEPICDAIPGGATLRVVRVFHDTARTGWSLAYHAHGYCAVDRLSYDDGVFPDRHMPVAHNPPASLTESPEGQVGGFDYLLFDRDGMTAAPPSDGVLVREIGDWQLYRRLGSTSR